MSKAVKVALIALSSVFTFIVNSTTVLAMPVTNSQSPYIKPEPDYAMWGKLAVSEAKKRYPKASVVDYRHVGRHAASPSATQEVFKLWMKENKHEFGVYVRITFNTKTEQILNISFQKTKH